MTRTEDTTPIVARSSAAEKPVVVGIGVGDRY
jgi:hypothetical protein